MSSQIKGKRTTEAKPDQAFSPAKRALSFEYKRPVMRMMTEGRHDSYICRKGKEKL
jgi:hypothetical protein